jgi:hypothetical protein
MVKKSKTSQYQQLLQRAVYVLPAGMGHFITG